MKPVDATRGLADFSNDLYALTGASGLGDRRLHLVGWSVWGAIAVRYAMDQPDGVASLTLVNPMPPTGSGGPGTPAVPHAGRITPGPGEGRSTPSSYDA